MGQEMDAQGKGGIWGAMAIERQLSGYPHHHAIYGGDGLRQGIKRVEMMNIWDEHFGIARVCDYRGEAAAKYLCKYINKGGDIGLKRLYQRTEGINPPDGCGSIPFLEEWYEYNFSNKISYLKKLGGR